MLISSELVPVINKEKIIDGIETHKEIKQKEDNKNVDKKKDI